MIQLIFLFVLSLFPPVVVASSAWAATPMVSAGVGYSVALKKDGTVWAWGENWVGELGNSNRVDCYSPVQVDLLTNVRRISSGVAHTIALKEDGTVWGWGLNNAGQVGDGTASFGIHFSPVQVVDLPSAIETIATGHNHSIAVGVDGTVWAWGDNGAGQLGDGSRTNRYRPVQVAGVSNVIAVAAGYQHTLVSCQPCNVVL